MNSAQLQDAVTQIRYSGFEDDINAFNRLFKIFDYTLSTAEIRERAGKIIDDIMLSLLPFLQLCDRTKDAMTTNGLFIYEPRRPNHTVNLLFGKLTAYINHYELKRPSLADLFTHMKTMYLHVLADNMQRAIESFSIHINLSDAYKQSLEDALLRYNLAYKHNQLNRQQVDEWLRFMLCLPIVFKGMHDPSLNIVQQTQLIVSNSQKLLGDPYAHLASRFSHTEISVAFVATYSMHLCIEIALIKIAQVSLLLHSTHSLCALLVGTGGLLLPWMLILPAISALGAAYVLHREHCDPTMAAMQCDFLQTLDQISHDPDLINQNTYISMLNA